MLHLMRRELPFKSQDLHLANNTKTVGLVIVDEVNGFCTVGAGHLAPVTTNKQITTMVDETSKLAKHFSQKQWPILAFLDCHEADKPEDPYPPHCIRGSGEDELVPELEWLEEDESTLLIRKDCINGFIGSMESGGTNAVVDWIRQHRVQQLLVVGICTDICVLDFVTTILSARNHKDMLAPLEDVYVYEKACATYDLSVDVAQQIEAQPHPQDIAHHMGLYIATTRGAKIIETVYL